MNSSYFICKARGISREDAINMIVNGFCKDVIKELPLEFAVEAQKLLRIKTGKLGWIKFRKIFIMIEIKNLHAAVDGKAILKGLNLHVKAGEIHAIMGPNGAGKSTLSKILAGDPSYEVLSGEIVFKGQSILELSPEERAHLGVFIGFQYPIEIPGISNFQFLHSSFNAIRKANSMPLLSEEEFLIF